MRATLVTAVAAHVQTAIQHAGAVHGSATAPGAKTAGSAFDDALDAILQGAGDDDDTNAAATPATDTKGDPARTAKADPSVIAKDGTDANTCQPILPRKDGTADPARLVAAKDADKPSDATKTDKDTQRHRDPAVAQAHLDTNTVTPPVAPVLPPQPQAAPTTNTPTEDKMASVAAAAAPQAADDQTDVPATDIAAAGMQPTGGATKPAKPGDGKPGPALTASKTQASSSAASKLADASNAAGRVFADQKTVSNAPPQTTHLDAAKPNGNEGKPLTQPAPATTQTNPNTGQPSQATQPQQQAAVQPAQPHTQTQPAQAPVGNAIAAATAAQQASAATTTGAATKISAQLQIAHPPATSTADPASLAFTIASKSQDGAKHFDIRLDPVELGRIDVHLAVDDAGKAQATLSVEKPQTLELLQKDSGHLERALKDSGFDLGQSGLSFSLKGQQQQAGNNNGGNANSSSRGRTLAARAIAAVDSAASTISLGQMSASDTRLDIKV
ncbi:MAG TPA: flagellar hook-length control protein FliK [Rhizomicrobium sp.]|jgi:flagellar hook-length control protein FliK|nr:flagellar hook-length control protein FliK [Rhizomicrobium sp.]